LLVILPNPTLSAKRDVGVGKKEIAIKVKRKKKKKKEKKIHKRKKKEERRERGGILWWIQKDGGATPGAFVTECAIALV
jgi:hypothetical protein